MHLIHFVINILQKCMSSADVWKYRNSVLGHEDCLAANSKSTGPPQKNVQKTVQSIAWYDQLPLSSRTQMLTASDFCCECTTVHQVRRSSSMETSIKKVLHQVHRMPNILKTFQKQTYFLGFSMTEKSKKNPGLSRKCGNPVHRIL